MNSSAGIIWAGWTVTLEFKPESFLLPTTLVDEQRQGHHLSRDTSGQLGQT